MFSATWPKEVRQLANKFLSSNRIHVTIGNVILAANPSICQIIEVCTESQKQNRFVKFFFLKKKYCLFIYLLKIDFYN